MPVRLAITNSVTLDGGDAAIVLSMAGSLRRELGPDTEIKVLCHSVEAARRLYGRELDLLPVPEEAHRFAGRSKLSRKLLSETFIPRSALGWLTPEERRVAEVFQWADAVVSCGGGFLTDRYSSGKRLAGLRLALASGTPLVFYAQSVGPFVRPGKRRAFRRVLERAAAITVRDAPSLEEVRALGLSAELTADEVFLFDAPELPGLPDLRAGLAPGRPLVAVSVRRWHFPGCPGDPAALRERYLASVAAAAERLVVARQARVIFLSTCQGVPEYGHDDSGLATRVTATLPEEVRREVQVDRAYHHPAELRGLLRQCDAVVATRMHAAILAMLGGTPALAIGYEAKSAGLYSRLGLGEWCLDIAGREMENLPEKAVALLDQAAGLRAELPAKVAELAAAARANARAVRKVLVARGVVADA